MVKRSVITGEAEQGWGGRGGGTDWLRRGGVRQALVTGRCVLRLTTRQGPPSAAWSAAFLSLPIYPSIALGGACMVRPWKVCLTVSANRLGLSASIAAACPAASRGAAE